MPDVHFNLRWPDGSHSRAYSPSSTIKERLPAGTQYPLKEFMPRVRAALEHASERVRQKYGYGCAHAAIQISQIEHLAGRFLDDDQASITVESYED